MGIDKVMMPVPDPHPDVFDREWPLRVADIDATGRMRLDAACRHIQDIGGDHLREMGFQEIHPLWIVRRTMVDLIGPIEFQDMLRLRRWCSGTSNRWCEMRVRIDGRKGGLIESEAFWININRETQGPARIADDFLEGLRRTTDIDRLRWKAYLKPGSATPPTRSASIRFDLPTSTFSITSTTPCTGGSSRITCPPPRAAAQADPDDVIEHDAAVALGDKLEIVSHVHPPGRPSSSAQNWRRGLLQLSHTRSATRRKPSRRSFLCKDSDTRCSPSDLRE